LTILGVRVEIPVTISFGVNSEGNGVVVQARAEGNLSGVQNSALDIARAMPVPRDNCARAGVNPVVDSIDSASISPSNTAALVTITGHVTAWVCAHPLGGTVKTILASDSVGISIPVQIDVVDQRQIGLKLAGPASVTTGHALTGEAVSLLTDDLNGSVTAALAKALDANEARLSLPNLPGLDVTIANAVFAADGAALLVRANGAAHMDSDSFNELLTKLTQ
jgi:hypothetical protein